VLGVGYYHYHFSDDLEQVAGNIATPIGFDSEQGVEAYYNCAVTPWLFVTADVQFIDPAFKDNDNAWVAGLRVTVKL
jgi:porin